MKSIIPVVLFFLMWVESSKGFSCWSTMMTETKKRRNSSRSSSSKTMTWLQMTNTSNEEKRKRVLDSYDANVTGGCIQNLENHTRLLDQSLKKSRGAGNGMFHWINEKQQQSASSLDPPLLTAQQLDTNTRFGVLSHGTQPDPIYNYGNMASLLLFEQTIDTLCQTPSRYSTVPELMEDRSNLIQEIETKGYGYIDNAIRISAKGNLFLIDEILVWTLFDDNDVRIGLAAIYDRNGVRPYDDNDKGC